MNFNSLSKRQWVLLSVSVVIVGVAFWAVQAGYLPEIGKFFAAEPGYVPSCAWYGEPVTPTQQCCSGFVPVSVSPLRPVPSYILNASTTPGGSAEYATPSPTLIGRPVPTSTSTITPPPFTRTPTPVPSLPYTRTPSPAPSAYCVMPGCQIVQRQVYCIQAPCPAQIEIVCPSGITPPPPRPTYTPTPTASITVSPIGRIQVFSPPSGAVWVVPGMHSIGWKLPADFPYPLSTGVIITLSRPGPGTTDIYRIGKAILSDGVFRWDTSLPVTSIVTGETRYLKDRAGTGYFISIQISGEQEAGNSGSFTLTTGPTPTPTPTSTVTPPPPYSKVLLNLGGPTEQVLPVAPGTQITIPVNLVTRGTVVTGIDFFGALNGNAQITGAAIGSAHFPEILRDSVYSNNNHGISFALGSGAGGGWATAEDIATITVTIDNAAQPGSTIEFINTPVTKITAAGIDTNVFGGGTRARFTVIAPPSKPGDANGDGKVDIFDYNLVVSNFGKTGTNVPGDVNKDGKVDIFDYNLVITNFGK